MTTLQPDLRRPGITLRGPLRVRLRTFRIICGLITVASVGVAGTGIYLASQWNKSTIVALDDVLSDFRDSTIAAPAPTVAPALDDAVPSGATTQPKAPAETPTGQPAATPLPVTPAPTPNTTPSGPPPGPAPYVRPAEGVYEYTTHGNETVSVGGARHDYPAAVFAVVRHTPCGYRLEVRVLEEHIDTTEICLDGTRLLLKSFNQRMTFMGQTGEGAFACAPPAVLVDRAAGPGSQHPTDCTAASLQATGTATYTGDTTVTIAGAQVPAQIALWRWSATGAATGAGSATWTFDETGLPVRMERENSTKSSSVLGPATHTESASFVLTSRTPKR